MRRKRRKTARAVMYNLMFQEDEGGESIFDIDYLLGSLGATATFTRSSEAWVTDHEGLVREVPDDFPVFDGMRLVRNLIDPTEQTTSASWDPGGTAPPTANASTTMDGRACASINFVGNTDFGYAGSRITCSTGVRTPVIDDHGYVNRASVYLSRALTGGEIITISHTGTHVLRPLNLTSTIPSGQWVEVGSTVRDIVGGDGLVFLAVYPAANLGSDITIYITNRMIEDTSGQSNVVSSDFVSDYTYLDYENGNTLTGIIITEASGAAITGIKGLHMQPQRTNLIPYSYDMSNAAWGKSNATAALDEVGCNGAIDYSSTITDATGAARGYVFDVGTVTSDTNNKSIMVYVKKTTSATEFPAVRFSLTGGTDVDSLYILNTDSGALSLASGYDAAAFIRSESVGDFWEVHFILTNINSTTATIYLYAAFSSDGTTADSAATGTAIIGYVGMFDSVSPGSPIFSNGAAVQQNADVLTYPLTTLKDANGSLEVSFLMGDDYDQNDLSGSLIVGVVNLATAGLVYFNAIEGIISSYDGTASNTTLITNWAKNQVVRVRSRWNKSGSIRALSSTKDGATLISDTDTNYDGSWNSDGTLYVGLGARDVYFQSIDVYRIDKGTTWLTTA